MSGSRVPSLAIKNQWIMETMPMSSEDFDLEMTCDSACLKDDDVLSGPMLSRQGA